MDQNRNHGKKCSVFNQIKNFLTRQVKMDARLLDFMQEHPEIAPDYDPLEAPPGEFQKILDEMRKRGIRPAIKRQLKFKTCLCQAGRYIQKPAFVALLVVLIIGGTSVGTSAKKAYDYRMREREVGKSNLVWNNDDHVIMKGSEIDKAYKEIEVELGIKCLKMLTVPFGMKYEHLEIKDGVATIKFSYQGNMICFIQAKNDISTSNNIVSDRNISSLVYNNWLDKNIPIEKNKLPEDEIEYSTYLNIGGAYYYIYGIMDESEFSSIICDLNF